ncbi:adenosylcobinamide kinase/adenosylcobinamide phosphate guanyltransferase [Lentibacillus kapialis]|uniref:Adenosylcobinamide kinase n=1 Tax=Lentibacillus kapialis TaxID=340214 RepID=A0A917PYF2_9BACI|nr:bifunctional adenosylcobinamide kinase/adenosylcobinamide-phosphate guanylyltransferase [Lentibacillus kapialis]GGJ99506.1 adenosylcobinamide kinase/adenosylcobinamide phosphate guanyltransferase [Lentibacillus kapialis]
METGELIFVTGGVRSGKSSYAENKAIELSRKSEAKLHYIACGMPSDEEMAERIARHQANRESVPVHWKTWECPYHLQCIAGYFSKQDILVLDCVTSLLNNYLFDCALDDPPNAIESILTDITCLQETAAALIVVSNEVTQGMPHSESFTRNYQYILGNVHQQIVYYADTVFLLENGLPICKKGAAS